MSVLDPRERVIKAGNELLDAIYECEQMAPLIDAERERLESGALAPADARSTAELIMRFLRAQARRQDALSQYLTVRELVEQFDAAAAARGTV